MTRILEHIETEGLAQLSYLVGDRAAGEAVVLDPRRDVEVYLQAAARHGVRLTHVLETHIHADFVSGSRELAARTGAPVLGGPSDDYAFPIRRLHDGDEIRVGRLALRALHTPGHTPEHLSFLLLDPAQGDGPSAVFTGDTLFNLDVGRPDLVGSDGGLSGARQLYRSLLEKLLPLGDRMEVYPGHMAGSACGKALGDRPRTTLGDERRFSAAFRHGGETAFVRWLLEGMPEPPRHYRRLKTVNARGPEVRGHVPNVPPLPPAEFRHRMAEEGAVVVDARSILAFGGGHVPGALSLPLGPQFPTWAGWMLDPEAPLLLVVDSPRDLETVVGHLFRVGYDRMAGWLHQGMGAWQDAALPLERLEQWTVHELRRRRSEEDPVVLDVRSDGEFGRGRIPGAVHAYAPHLAERLSELDPARPIATYCGTGYRASVAASVLQRNGFARVANVPGSWRAWKAAGYEVEGAPAPVGGRA